MRELLTVQNPKIAKGAKFGWHTAALHLAPWKSSGYQVCIHATGAHATETTPEEPGCIIACLDKAGRAELSALPSQIARHGHDVVAEARKRRTRLFFRDPVGFWERFDWELRRQKWRAKELGLKFAVRLNATSDLPWERIKCGEHANVMEKWPDVTWYDYSAYPLEKRGVGGVLPPNYSLTYSLKNATKWPIAEAALKSGANIAVVSVYDRPASWRGWPTVDGDRHDLRFLDERPAVVWLKLKGRAQRRAAAAGADFGGFLVAA